MSKLKALQILSSLSKDEFSKFSRYIESPYFNRSKDQIKFFNLVKKFYPDFPEEKISFEKIYKKLYPKNKYNEGTVRNLFSDLGNLAERYLSFCVYENCFFYKYNLLIEYNDRRLDKLFEKTSEKFHSEEIDSLDYTGQKDLHLFLMEKEMSANFIRQNKKSNIGHEFSQNENLLIFTLKQLFSSYYSLMAARNNYNLESGENILDIFFDNVNIGAISEFLIKNSKKAKTFELDCHLYNAQKNFKNNYFDDLKKAAVILYSLDKETSLGEKYSLYIKISDIANRFMTSDDDELKKFVFMLKKKSVEEGFTSEQISGRLKVAEFILIFDSAINVNETDWAENFIKNKIKTVSENQRNDLYNYCMARILFERGEFENSNEFLAKVNSENPYYKMELRALRMKNLYELGYMESCFSQADAFKQYLLRSSEVSEKRGIKYSNFVKFYKRLIKIKSGESDDTEIVKGKIKECNAVRNKKWLIEKFELLK